MDVGGLFSKYGSRYQSLLKDFLYNLIFHHIESLFARVTWISCSGGWGFKANSSSIRIEKVREEGNLMFELIGVRNECGWIPSFPTGAFLNLGFIPKWRLNPSVFTISKAHPGPWNPSFQFRNSPQTQVSALQDPKACQCLRFDHQSKWAGWGYDDNPKMRGDCSTFRNSSNGKFTPTYRQLHMLKIPKSDEIHLSPGSSTSLGCST